MNLTTLEECREYDVRVLSRPGLLPGDTEETADYKIGPWVVLLENFLSKEESNHHIELGAVDGYKTSHSVGALQSDRTYKQKFTDSRTSSNAWCKKKCESDPLVGRVIQRLENVTGIPSTNGENLQLLKYEEGQYYRSHHDYIPHLKKHLAGVRILTVFLYLNDVEEGGGTKFNSLDITVKPKQGSALIWPSVMDENPNEMDGRTLHEAMPVIKGIKYGANAWIHQRDFRTEPEKGCPRIVA